MIFASHDAHRTKEAGIFKRLAIKHRRRMDIPVPDIFLSSDASSIGTGTLWLPKIFEALEKCDHFVALICDKADIENRWILFETAFVNGRKLEPMVFVFGQINVKEIPWPLGALHLIDTGNTDRVWEALGKIGVGRALESQNEFAHLFRQCGCHRDPKEPCPGAST